MIDVRPVVQASISLPAVMLIAFFTLLVIEVCALYLRQAGFTVIEIIMLTALPLFSYLAALPAVGDRFLKVGETTVEPLTGIARTFDLPLFHLGNAVIGVNLIGFSIPVFISVKMLLQKRIPIKKTLLLVAIISAISYLYTRFDPDRGMVIYFFAVPPILAAAIAFMFKKTKGAGDFNPALLSYAGATLGILIGVDLGNLFRVLNHPWDEGVFVSIGGASALDAIFLAGAVALIADLIFREQEENILGSLVKLITGGRQRD